MSGSCSLYAVAKEFLAAGIRVVCARNLDIIVDYTSHVAHVVQLTRAVDFFRCSL